MWTTVGRGRAIRNEKFDVESGAYVGIDFEAKLDFAPWLGLMKLGWGSVWAAVAARHSFSNFAPRCFYCTLQCSRNVVERNLSFPTRILSFSNSSGVARTSPLTVFAQFGGRRRVSAVRFGGIFGSFLGFQIDLWSPMGTPGIGKYAISKSSIFIQFLHAMKSAIFVFRECVWTGWGHFLVSFGLIFWRLRRPPDDHWGAFGSHRHPRE